MLTAIWIIAVCEVIRMLQNMAQLVMVKHDSGERDNAYKAFVESLKDDEKEIVKKTMEEFERIGMKDDIRYCASDCGLTNCPRNKANIRNPSILHSWCLPNDIPDCPLQEE